MLPRGFFPVGTGMPEKVSTFASAPAQERHKDRVARGLMRDISEGYYPPHTPLPSYRDIAAQYGVSTRTVGSAVGLLEAEGLIYRAGRRGAFVRPVSHGRRDENISHRLRCVNFITGEEALKEEHVRKEYLAGYTEALDRHDVRMRFGVLSEETKHFETLFPPGADLRMQGCVLISVTNPALLRWLRERQIPFVVQSYAHYLREGLPPCHMAYINKYQGVFDATNYLLALGHRRIGRIESLKILPHVLEPHEGYRAALRYAGLPDTPNNLLCAPLSDPALFMSRVTEYLRRESRPTAVLTTDDATAIAVLQAARSLGIRVPEDLSIVGFNNESETEQTDPPLTTVSNPRRTLARTAVEMLLAVAGEYDSFETRVLDCHLVVRESTAAVRG